MKLFNALALETEYSTSLSTLRKVIFFIAVDSRNGDLSTKNGFCIGYRYIAVNIIALASEHRVRLYVYIDKEIAGRTAVDTTIALTAASECLTVSNTSRDVDRNSLLHSYSAYSAALRTWILDDLALS